MARLASQPKAGPGLAARIDSALAAATRLERQSRDVYLATVESRSCGRVLGIENKGSLDHLLYGLRLQLHQIGETKRHHKRESLEVAR